MTSFLRGQTKARVYDVFIDVRVDESQSAAELGGALAVCRRRVGA